jgi:hypothetical protein
MFPLKIKLIVEHEDNGPTAEFMVTVGENDVIGCFLLENPKRFSKAEYMDFIQHRRENLQFGDATGSLTMRWFEDHSIIFRSSHKGGNGLVCLYFDFEIIREHLVELANQFQ